MHPRHFYHVHIFSNQFLKLTIIYFIFIGRQCYFSFLKLISLLGVEKKMYLENINIF